MRMILEELYSPELIRDRVEKLGAEISADFKDKPLVMVCVLKGAFIFFADLVRSLSIKPEMDFVRLSSYADKTSSSGKVVLSKNMETTVKDKNILIVEDIVDTGISASSLIRILEGRGPASISLCALMDKRERRQVRVKIDYAGFVVQQGFVVGYGLDHAEQYRNLPGIFKLIPEE